jgi:hypothetical protein
MEAILHTVAPIALIIAIACIVAAVCIHIVAAQTHGSRETLRALRVALERDPTPSQIGEALQMWPEASKYAVNQQKLELIKCAHNEETKRAQKTEVLKGLVRTIFFVAAFAGAVYVASIFIKVPEETAPTTTTTPTTSS